MSTAIRLLLLLSWIAALSSAADADLVISKLDRRIELSSHIVRVLSTLKVENMGPGTASEVLFALPNNRAKNLANVMSVYHQGKGKGKGKVSSVRVPIVPVEPEGMPPELTFYSISLPGELEEGGSLTLEVLTVFTHSLTPFPEEITQADVQLVVYQDSAYFLSPYEVKFQTLAVRLPGGRVESYTKYPNTKLVDTEIRYGPFENVPAFSYVSVVVHFENNNPFAVAQALVREIEISHWGNVQVTEHYNLIHGGARNKGGFSRIDYQGRPPKGISSFNHLIAKPDIKVESRDWDVSQVNEAGLEREIVPESPELLKSSLVEVESGDRDASQGNESVMSELLGVLESSTAASEQNIEFGDASQVNAAELEVELVIESSATLEITKFDGESARDVVKEEIIELPKSSNVIYELDIEKNSIPVVSQVKEAGLELEIKNVNAESTTCVVEGEETVIIRLPERGGVEESAGVESVESLLHGEDEWEGIQRSDVEKFFGVAASYTSSTSGVEAVSRLSSDVQMELYGLHKVATEGPCYEPQPLALMVTARAKWHAWQRLGSVNPEVAMEQYISLLTRNVPEWMGAKPGGNIKQEVDGTMIPDSGPSLYSEPSSIIERESEDHIGVDISSAIRTLSGQDST